MPWIIEKDASEFARWRETWNEINRSNWNHVALDADFAESALAYLGSEKVRLARFEDEGGCEALTLVAPAGKAAWSTYQPSQAPIGLLVFRQGFPLVEHVRELFDALGRLVLSFSFLRQDVDYTFLDGAEREELEILSPIEIPRLTIRSDFETYWNARGKNLRKNLRRQRKRLEESGAAVELRTLRGVAEMRGAITEYGRMESAGWKGEEGTAVAIDNAQGGFYLDLFERFCARGEGVVYQFVIDGKVVSSDLCVRRGGMIVILKTTYDESCDAISPSLLMREDITRELFDDDETDVIEFYGEVKDWHLKWTDELRPLQHFNFFRNALVRGTRSFVKKIFDRSR